MLMLLSDSNMFEGEHGPSMLNHSLFAENFLWMQIFLFSTTSSYFSSRLYVFASLSPSTGLYTSRGPWSCLIYLCLPATLQGSKGRGEAGLVSVGKKEEPWGGTSAAAPSADPIDGCEFTTSLASFPSPSSFPHSFKVSLKPFLNKPFEHDSHLKAFFWGSPNDFNPEERESKHWKYAS